MRPFRSRLLLRLVATLLVAGVASTLAPPAAAREAQEDVLRSLLNDAEAFEVALQAAEAAGVGPAAVDAFVDAYVEAVGGAVAPELIYQILDGKAFGLVAPVLPDDAFVPAPTAGPTLKGSTAAVLAASLRGVVPAAPVAFARYVAPTVLRVEGRSLQPRAP